MMGEHPNLFFKFSGAHRPTAEKVDQEVVLDLVEDQRALGLKVKVSWWEDLPFGQEIHGTTDHNGIKYDATIVVQSSPVGGLSTNPIDSDYVKLTHKL